MLLRCPRCSRLNPPEALFCFLDGADLGDPSRRRGMTDPGKVRFPMPFVFPSGQACHSFDELALAVYQRWEEARGMLKDGVLASFLASLGRTDLARGARQLASDHNTDRALDALVQGWPTGVLDPPRLVVDPVQLNLGSMRVGQDLRFDLHLRNLGLGLLTGEVACEDAPWLAIGTESSHSRKKIFQILHEMTMPILVRGKSFAAAARPLQGRVVVNSSAGQVLVPVCVEVPVLPFPDGVLAGATTPRQVAQKARENPKESADLFAQGAVARWYAANGWTYPVLEPSASGLAAVQQFFEALGLTTPPVVELSAREVRLSGRGGDILRETLQVVAQEKKPVFANAVSDRPWLTVNQVELDGRTATVHLRVPEVPDRAGETLRALVTITSNGRRRFVVPVHLTVTAPMPLALKWAQDQGVDVDAESAELPRLPPPFVRPPAPPIERVEVARLAPKPPRAEQREDKAPVSLRRYAMAALPVVFLAFGLLVTLVRDLATWRPRAVPGGDVPAPAYVDLSQLPQELAIQFHDQEEAVGITVNGSMKPTGGRAVDDILPARWEPSMRFGLQLLNRGATGARLTYKPRGQTNNTVVRLDGREWIFGERPFRLTNGQYAGNWPGRWVDRDRRVEQGMRDGRRSVWVYDREQVEVTQTVGLVAGAQSGKIDTCLVHYRIDNRDTRPHQVGLRFLLDTFIGDNDGVPFLIPGSPQLCNTFREFRTEAEVPDFIQARETEDLERPGTIALVQLKVPGYEAPSRVVLGAWPNPELGPPCRQEKTMWTVPALPMKSLGEGDSAVTMYWDTKSLPAGDSRDVAFAYGLGRVAAGEAGGQLGLSAAGSFAPGGVFTLTAEVRRPTAGQTLTLTLPPGFALAGGAMTEAVPGAGSAVSAVTWRVRAGAAGMHTLRVSSSTGTAQTLPVKVRVRGIFGN